MDEKRLAYLFEGLDLRDVRMDRQGRIQIDNSEIGRRFKEMGDIRLIDELASAGNGICCGNGSCASEELISLFDRLVGGRRLAER